MLHFVHRCLNSRSPVVAFVARHAIFHVSADSIMDRNVMCSGLRYNVSKDDILTSDFSPHDIYRRYNIQDDAAANIATLLLKHLQCRDGNLRLTNGNFDSSDITTMIDLLCTY